MAAHVDLPPPRDVHQHDDDELVPTSDPEEAADHAQALAHRPPNRPTTATNPTLPTAASSLDHQSPPSLPMTAAPLLSPAARPWMPTPPLLPPPHHLPPPPPPTSTQPFIPPPAASTPPPLPPLLPAQTLPSPRARSAIAGPSSGPTTTTTTTAYSPAARTRSSHGLASSPVSGSPDVRSPPARAWTAAEKGKGKAREGDGEAGAGGEEASARRRARGKALLDRSKAPGAVDDLMRSPPRARSSSPPPAPLLGLDSSPPPLLPFAVPDVLSSPAGPSQPSSERMRAGSPSLTQPYHARLPRRDPSVASPLVDDSDTIDDDMGSQDRLPSTLEMERPPTHEPQSPQPASTARPRSASPAAIPAATTATAAAAGQPSVSLTLSALAAAAPPLPPALQPAALLNPDPPDPSLSPRSAAQLASAIAALDDDDPSPGPARHAGGAAGERRSFRQRTSLQLNPYTRERAAYRHLLARGGLEAAIVQRREELKGQTAGAHPAFVPSLEKDPAGPPPADARVKGGDKQPPRGATSERDARLLEAFGGALPADEEEEDELDLLASVGRMGGGELARWEAAVRQRKEEDQRKRRKEAAGKARKAAPARAAFPIELGRGGAKENRAPAKYVPPPGLLDHIAEDEDDADYSAFGLHQSTTTADPSPPKKTRKRRAPRESDGPTSANDSDSGQSIETDPGGGRAAPAPVGLDRKRARILGRMMPAVAANRHLDQIRRAAAERERAAKFARRQQQGAAGGPDVGGPIRAGQSVVRRAPGAAAKPLVIDGDPESSDDDAVGERGQDDGSLARNSLGHHRRLNALFDRDEVDPAVVAAMYPDDGLLSDDSASSGGTIELLDDEDDDDGESDDAPAQVDIRQWLTLPAAAPKAPSVVDLMLSRTRTKARAPRPAGGGGGGGARRTTARPPKAQYQPRDARPNKQQQQKHAARRSSPVRAHRLSDSPPIRTVRAAPRDARPRRPRPIVLDDDSIYGDVPPRPAGGGVGRGGGGGGGGGRRGPARPRTGAYLPRPAAARRGLPPAALRNPPLYIPRQGGRGASDAAAPAPPQPQPLDETALLAQGVAGPRLPAAMYAPPEAPPSSPRVAQPSGRLEGVAWASYASFSLDFDIRPLTPGLSFPPESDIRQGRLEDFLGLLRTTVDQLPPPPPAPTQAFDVQLDPAMQFVEFDQVFRVLVDRLFECADGEPPDPDVKRETTPVEDAWAATRFACAFATARQADADFEDAFFGPVFDTLDHLLERLEALSTPTTAGTEAARVFFRLHWFALELLVRLSLASAAVGEQVRDSLAKVAEVLIRRLLEYGFNRTIKSVKTASTGADDGCVGDYTAELWVGLVHVFGQLAVVPGALPLDATLSSLVTTASDSTAFPSQGLLAAERTWYLVQGLSALSQFTAAGRVYAQGGALPAQWALVAHAVGAVKLESDPVADKLASSTALTRRDKYAWTVLGRCHLMVSRWGWTFDVHDTLLGLLCQKVFKSRGFVKLHSDPTSDFPLFLRESDQALVEAVDGACDSAFDVFLKLLHLAVRDFGRAGADGTVPVKQAERAIARLLAISAPVGRTPFTRKQPPTLRELSTLINRYSFTMVAVFLNPSVANAAHSLRLSQSFLDFAAADFKSRKVCVRAAMYLAVLHKHFDLGLGAVADWLGQMADTLLREHAVVTRGAGIDGATAAAGQLAPLSEIIWLLSMVLGSIRHILGSRGMDGKGLAAFPDPALLHKSWTDGILSSSLAFEPITGAEVVQCVQAFLDARRTALAAVAGQLAPNIAADSQDEFAFEFAPMDFDDPSLRLLLGEADVPAVGPAAAAPDEEPLAATMARQDREFAAIVGHTVSPAIYRLLGNLLSADDQGWLRMVGGGRDQPVATREDVAAREAYVGRLVDCWAGCAAVLVQHGLRDWSSYVELGAESWKRFGAFAARRQVGLRFLWNVIGSDPLSFATLREDVLSIWFQTIVAPPSTWTIEPAFTASLLHFDADIPGSLFVVVPFARLALEDDDGMAEGEYDVSPDELRRKRGHLLDEVFTSIAIEVARPAAGDVALQQRKALLVSLVRDMLLSLSDFYLALEGAAKQNYLAFALDVVERLKERSGAWLTERSVRELAYWNAVGEGFERAAAAERAAAWEGGQAGESMTSAEVGAAEGAGAAEEGAVEIAARGGEGEPALVPLAAVAAQ